MAPIARKLVTIIAPDFMEDTLVPQLFAMGWGMSVVPVHGRGRHGARPDTWHGANIEIQVVTDAERVDALLAVLERDYLHPTPVVAWITDVQGWPPAAFGGE